MDTALAVITPPAAEPLSVAQAVAHCRIDSAVDDSYVGALITAARSWAEEFLARALITQTLQWTAKIRNAPVTPGVILPLLAFPTGQGGCTLLQQTFELPRSPVQSIGSVVTTDFAGNVTTLASTAYGFDTDLEPARLALSLQTGQAPVQRVQVQFQAGYGADATNVPTPILQGILMLIAFLYENRGDAGGDDMPRVAERLLMPYRITTFGG